MTDPFFSVIVPVRDGGPAFERCLEALERSTFGDRELIVVDDGSTDGSAARGRTAGARVLSTPAPAGPAAARNLGARYAHGRWLLFLDADCAVHADTLERAARTLAADPGLDAVFGGYDADPAAPGTVSRFRNLLHHWTHQRGRSEASTFWAGCGAIRRETLEALGGFDAARYPRPSVEDIELGRRLCARGGRVRLDPAVQVTHLKAWTLADMIRTDVLRRAAPWTELALRSGGLPRDLNVDVRGRVGVAAACAGAACLAASPWAPPLAGAGVALAAGASALHLDFHRLLARRGGIRLVLAGVPLHLLHLLCAGAGFALGAARALRRPRRGDARFEHRERPELGGPEVV
ncbi:MAG TPA: glycosyltransferase family A protein [Gemmatimonadota bacterium]|nr:glycosyltransferase family A protein [Gemmatimonadota bacterium]